MDRLTYSLSTVIRKYNVISKYIWFSNNQFYYFLKIIQTFGLVKSGGLNCHIRSDDMTWIDEPTLKITSQEIDFQIVFWEEKFLGELPNNLEGGFITDGVAFSERWASFQSFLGGASNSWELQFLFIFFFGGGG